MSVIDPRKIQLSTLELDLDRKLHTLVDCGDGLEFRINYFLVIRTPLYFLQFSHGQDHNFVPGPITSELCLLKTHGSRNCLRYVSVSNFRIAVYSIAVESIHLFYSIKPTFHITLGLGKAG